ncbi:MAG: RuvA terminal domain, partial [Actinomycetota bacterium]
MISHLSGSIIDVRLNQLVIDVSGIGYQVTVAPELAAESRVGEKISLHTSLV